jgi:hypothetical protein
LPLNELTADECPSHFSASSVQSDISFWSAAYYATLPISSLFYCIARILFLAHLVRFVVKLQVLRTSVCARAAFAMHSSDPSCRS